MESRTSWPRPISMATAPRDVVAVSVYQGREPSVSLTEHPDEPHRVYVDALSGKDGRVLWIAHEDLPHARLTPHPSPAVVGPGTRWLAALGGMQLGGEDPDPAPMGSGMNQPPPPSGSSKRRPEQNGTRSLASIE